ncbi:MAG: DUF3883 domain-containing protein, partial [Actinomycetota bacterium]
ALVLHFVVGEVIDGNGEVVRRTFATVQTSIGGQFEQDRRVSLFDVVPPGDEVAPASESPASATTAQDPNLIVWARQHIFERLFKEARGEREGVAGIQEDFLRRSFGSLMSNADEAIIAADEEIERRVQGAEGRLRKAELVKKGLELRRNQRLEEAERGRTVTRGPVQVVGSALLLPLPASTTGKAVEPQEGTKHSDPEIEQIAVAIARHYEEERGAVVKSKEDEKVGFDLLSLRNGERRCIEVKGRAGVQRVELTWGEFAKSQELGDDYWLYVVLDCGKPEPRLFRVQNPAKSLAGAWQPSLDVRYRVEPEPVIEAAQGARA